MLDLENRKLVVALINMGLERHLFAKGLRVDRSRRGPARFFFPPEDGRSRVIGWRPFKKEASRTVAKPYLRGDETRFWLHQAAYIKPVFLAARFYLQITPTWLLTRDGTTVMGGPEVGKVVIQWAGRERNSSILYHVRFWTWILGNRSGPLHVRLGDQFMEVSPIPAYVHQSYGIEWDRGNLMDDLERDAPRIARTEDAIEVEDAPDEEPTGGEVVVDAREDAEERDAAE